MVYGLEFYLDHLSGKEERSDEEHGKTVNSEKILDDRLA